MDKITDNFSDPSGSLAPNFAVDILSDDSAGVTIEEIKIEAAKVVEEAPEELKRIRTGEDLMNNKIEQIPCLLEPFFPEVGIVCLAGSSDTGKSMILRQLVIAVVLGLSDFLGWVLNAKRKSAIVVQTEDDPNAISFCLSRQAKGVKPSDLRNLRFVFEHEDIKTELDAMLTEQPADIVIVDCFGDAYGNDLKDTTKIRAYLNICQSLAMKHQTLFLFLHHTTKRSENFEPNKNNLLAGQGLEAKMRCVVELRADPARADHRHWCVVKGNYLASDHKNESYVLAFDEKTFLFSKTDERTPNEMLAKRPDDGGRAKQETAKALWNEGKGKTLDEIATIMGYKNRGSVSKLINRSFD